MSNYTIKVIDSLNGTITPSTNQTVASGGTVNFTFTPKDGYIIKSVYIDNVDLGNLNSYSFTNVQSNHSIYVQYIKADSLINISYNSLSSIKLLSYKVIEYLVKNNDIIWKLLKYPSSDALSQDFLTIEEKQDLIYNGKGEGDNHNVFRTAFLDDLTKQQVSHLRIYLASIRPENRTVANVTFAIETVVHNKIMSLDTLENRLELLTQQVIETLNGAAIKGIIGKLVFDRDKEIFNSSSLNIYNNRNYVGFTTFMTCKVGNLNSPLGNDII